MKPLLLLAALFLAFSVPNAHAFMRHHCIEQNGGKSELLVRTFLAEGPYNLVADWNYGKGTNNANSVHFTGSSMVDPSLGGYSIVDNEGNTAILTLITKPVFHNKCGRAGCDFDGSVRTTAVLKYLDREMSFVCR